jgi:hypothetical protein
MQQVVRTEPVYKDREFNLAHDHEKDVMDRRNGWFFLQVYLPHFYTDILIV